MRNLEMFQREKKTLQRLFEMVGSQIYTKGSKEVGLIWPEAGKGEE